MQTQKSREKRKPRARCWVLKLGAMGALVAFTVGNSRAVAIGYARRADAAGAATQNQGKGQVLRFDIPAGTLEEALNAFQRLTGLRVVVPDEKMRSISSPGVSGAYTPEQALAQILTGTGVTYRRTASDTLTLEIQAAPESVEVVGRTSPLSSPKYTEPLRDIPQTVTIIPKDVIVKQGATTLRDVLRNVPGLTMTAGEGGAPAGDNLTLRGFSARNDIFVDGVRDLGPQSRDPFNLEQVEVVKGPGSAYTGRGSAGGTINLTSKAPGPTASYGGTLVLGNAGMKRGTADLNAPLRRLGLGERTAFRLNLLAHDSGVAGRDVVEEERWGAAPSLAFSPDARTRVTLSYFHLQQDNVSDYGIPWVTATNNVLREYRDRPAPVPRNTFYGFRDRDREKLRSDLATFRLDREFNDNLRLSNQLRYGRSTRDSMATPPRFASNDSTVINREMRSWLTEDDIWDNQTDLRAAFKTGEVEHTLVTGLALTRERNVRRLRTAPNAQTTLFNPNTEDVYTGAITLNPFVGDITANSQALYAFDTARVGRKWEFNGGLRWDRFDAAGVAVGTTNATTGAFTPGAAVARVDRMFSFRAGAVFKPKEEGSIYAAYGTSLSPSLEGLSYGTANTAIDPEKTYTFEAGSKWELFKSRILVSGAVFRVEKTNARTPGLPGEPPQVLNGRQRVDGVELSASGRVVRGWQLFAGYTFLDSEIVRSNAPLVNGISEVGKDIINTPRNSFSLWTTYNTPWKLELGGGARFVGRRFGNNINTRQVEGYWLLDMMASYPLGRHVDLRLNVNNLTDEYYFDRLGGGHLVPGAARTVQLSTSFNF